jgi:serine/threonine-protein kinase
MFGMQSRARHVLVPLASLVLLTHTSWLMADTSPQEKARAEALFDQSITLMKAGSFADACPKLAESQRIDPAVGTLLYLGDCLDKTGHVAAAWATFREANALARTQNQTQRADLARDRAASLEKKLPYLRFDGSSASNVTELTLDGTQIGRATWTDEMPVDPGDHAVEVSAKGFVKQTLTVHVGPAEHRAVTLPVLAKEPAAAKPAPEPTPDTTPKPAVITPTPDRANTGQWRRPASYALGGAGVVGVAIGSAFGVTAFSKWDSAKPLCPNDHCTHEGAGYASDARSASTVSTVAFTAGIVLIAAGAYLFFTSPPRAGNAGTTSINTPFMGVF